MNIIVGFSKAKGFKPFSWAIRLFEGTEYSHTYIKFYSEKYDRWMIYQASKSMVNFVGHDVFLEHNEVVREFSFEITEEERTKLIVYAIDTTGKPYSINTIFGIFLKMIGINVPSLFDGEKGYVCSELVGRALKDIMHWTIVQNLDSLTPKQIYDIACAKAEELEKV